MTTRKFQATNTSLIKFLIIETNSNINSQVVTEIKNKLQICPQRSYRQKTPTDIFFIDNFTLKYNTSTKS